jgi:hypothetical protein
MLIYTIEGIIKRKELQYGDRFLNNFGYVDTLYLSVDKDNILDSLFNSEGTIGELYCPEKYNIFTLCLITKRGEVTADENSKFIRFINHHKELTVNCILTRKYYFQSNDDSFSVLAFGNNYSNAPTFEEKDFVFKTMKLEKHFQGFKLFDIVYKQII